MFLGHIAPGGRLRFKNVSRQLGDEKIPGEFSSWNLFSDDPNAPLVHSLDTLSRMSASLYHAYPALRASVFRFKDFTIGSGLFFKSEPDHEMLGISQNAGRIWGRRFQHLINNLFKMIDFYETQKLALPTALITGDALVWINHNSPSSPAGFSVHASRGQQIDFRREAPGTLLGVTPNELMKADGAYLVNKKEHYPMRSPGGVRLFSLVHFPEMAEQLRGYPLAYSMISPAKNHDRYEDAVVAKAVMESLLFGTTSEDVPSFREQLERSADADRPKNGLNKTVKSFFGRRERVADQPGTMLLSGAKNDEIKPIVNQTPGANHGQFNDWVLKKFAMSNGISPNVLAADHRENSYATAKAEQDYSFARFLSLRKTFAKNTVIPVVEEALRYFIGRGMITAPGAFSDPFATAYWLRGRFLGPKFKAMNPKHEIDAAIKKQKAGALARSELADLGESEYASFLNRWRDDEEDFLNASSGLTPDPAEQEETEND